MSRVSVIKLWLSNFSQLRKRLKFPKLGSVELQLWFKNWKETKNKICLPSLNGCNHNESEMLWKLEPSGWKGVSLIHFCLFLSPHMFILDGTEPSIRCSETWKYDSERVMGVWRIELEIPGGTRVFNQEASVLQFKYDRKAALFCPTPVSSVLSRAGPLFLSTCYQPSFLLSHQ